MITVPDAGSGRRRGCSEHSDPTPPTIQLDQSHTPATHTFTCPPTVTCHLTVPCKSVGAVSRLRISLPPCCRTGAAPEPLLLHPRHQERNEPLSFYLRHVCPHPLLRLLCSSPRGPRRARWRLACEVNSNVASLFSAFRASGIRCHVGAGEEACRMIERLVVGRWRWRM